ncbi:hypothetical protein RHCRD62_20709 [Rhodococcus sp. RD6.2]|nr:hypothetical protein RHCRD62_20709 [Rhodococcus sp. RD6.2]
MLMYTVLHDGKGRVTPSDTARSSDVLALCPTVVRRGRLVLMSAGGGASDRYSQQPPSRREEKFTIVYLSEISRP